MVGKGNVIAYLVVMNILALYQLADYYFLVNFHFF